MTLVSRFTMKMTAQVLAVLVCPFMCNCAAQPHGDGADSAMASSVTTPDGNPVDTTLAPMCGLIERYSADRGNLERFYDAPLSPARFEREQQFLDGWRATLESIDFENLDQDGRVDYLLFANQIRYEERALRHELARNDALAPLLGFAPVIVDLHERFRRLESVDPAALAKQLTQLAEHIEQTHDARKAPTDDRSVKATVANRAARTLGELRRTLRHWYRFYSGYDPLFTWWVREPYEQVDAKIDQYAKFIREKLAGIEGNDTDAIIGDPIGRDELLSRLEYEMIPYTPEQLIAIAEREYAWCRREMLRASNELGFGDDWHAALEHVKTLHVEPGEQPAMIRDLAWEAVEFLEQRDLVTIPELCKETWRMEMMSPARQKVSPYFLGGESIIVSFPTDGMAHEDKLMSLRGNNIHFSRATVQHELIPGHHLQGFMTRRYRTHRRPFGTPFWGEGWALYWEMLLWDLGFPQSPENRVGMLFWRSHRCARIIFSLSFHLEQMTAQECIEFLIENVGHERNNATAEVRRSVSGDYGPLYQAAYMLGGLQIRAMHEDLVQSGRMTDRDFHDTILQNNSIPIAMVRAALTGQTLTRDFVTDWRFYGEIAESDSAGDLSGE